MNLYVVTDCDSNSPDEIFYSQWECIWAWGEDIARQAFAYIYHGNRIDPGDDLEELFRVTQVSFPPGCEFHETLEVLSTTPRSPRGQEYQVENSRLIQRMAGFRTEGDRQCCCCDLWSFDVVDHCDECEDCADCCECPVLVE